MRIEWYFMLEVPNAFSYVMFAAIIVAIGSVAVAWGPLTGITSFAVADQPNTAACVPEQCNAYDVTFCDDRVLKQADYECVNNRCQLVGKQTLTKCNFDCFEPDDGDARCRLAVNT